MKNSRIKPLISSVSMLLVAVLSLSVATYAWFTSSGLIMASGINIKSQRTSGILLSHYTGTDAEWLTRLNLDVQKLDLKPVSTVDCQNWFTAYAANRDTAAYEENGRSLIKKVDEEYYGKYFIAKEFYIKSVGEDITATYEINVTPCKNGNYNDETQLEYIRVAMVYENYFSEGNKTAISRFYSYDYENEGLIDEDGNLGTYKVSDYVTGNIRLQADTPQKITLYVWYEGEDQSCIDSAAGVRSIVDIAFTKASSGGVVN